MNARQPTILAVLILALLALAGGREAQAVERWPPWQSYGEAEDAARAKQKRRAVPRQSEIDALNRQIEQLATAGDSAKAIPVAERALQLTERRHGRNHAETAAALTRLAELMIAEQRYGDAEPLLKRALDIREKGKGSSAGDIAVALDNLAVLYQKQGRAGEALPLTQRAVAYRDKQLASDPSKPVPNLKSLGDVPLAAPKKAPHARAAPPPAQSAPEPAPQQGAAPPATGEPPMVEQFKRDKTRALTAQKYAKPDEAAGMRAPSAAAPESAEAPAAAPPSVPEPKSAEAPAAAPPEPPAAASESAEAPPAAGEDSEAVRGEAPEGGSGAGRAGGGGAAQPGLTSEPSAGAAPSASAPPAAAAPAPDDDILARRSGGGGGGSVQPGLTTAPSSVPSAPALPPPPPAAANGEPAAEARECARGLGVQCPPSAAAEPQAPAAAAAANDEQKWDVVPVFFGTDRAEEPNPKRLSYNSDRGRRLELGRALVTVPKAHQVPQIERPWAIRIPYFDVTIYEQAEDPEKHFTMEEIKKLSKEDFLRLVRERLGGSARFKEQALVFVHGYNTSFDNAVYRTAQIAYDLKFDGAPFLYSWPSGGGVASYTYDRESAEASKPYMREFLEMVVKETGAKQVSIIAHSMGNQPLLDVLKDMKSATPEGVVISQVILAAPDVDADSFANLAQAINGFARGVTLYAAANDRALIVSRNFWGHARAGDVPADGPLVLPGVDTIDVTAASTDAFAINHSGYAQNNKLLTDIGELLQTGLRPPDERALKPERVTTQKGDYWRFAAPATGSVGTGAP